MNNILGNRIKNLRSEKNISQSELAKFLNISNSTLSQYESGQRVPSDEVKIKIAKFFSVTIDYLLGQTDKKTFDTEIISFNKNGFDTEGLTQEDVEMVRSIIDNLKKKNENQKK